MSFQPLMLKRAIAPTTAALAVGTLVFRPRTVYAESPEELEARKKPIYDDFEEISSPPTETPSRSVEARTTTKSAGPTPTDRLAIQIGKSRVFLHAHVAAVETRVNSMMDSFLHLENSFTSTIAGLAPRPESGEKLMPGSIYVLVAGMTGSIISRNRNIVLRGMVPLAVGIGAGWVVLPVTMRNISDLLWQYEKKFPVIADTHIRTRDSVTHVWEMARLHTKQAARVVDEKVGEGRDAVEGWVKKGK